jgi:hypothetical protein
MQELTETFSSALNVNEWNNPHPANLKVSGGVLHLVMDAGTANYFVTSTRKPRDFRGSWAGAQVVKDPGGNTAAILVVVSADGARQVSIYSLNGQLIAGAYVKGRTPDEYFNFGSTAIPFLPIFVRVKANPSFISYEYQERDGDFAEFSRTDFAFDMDRDLNVSFWLGTHNYLGPENVVRTGAWDNVNLPR